MNLGFRPIKFAFICNHGLIADPVFAYRLWNVATPETMLVKLNQHWVSYLDTAYCLWGGNRVGHDVKGKVD